MKKQFIFESYTFDAQSRQLKLSYTFDNGPTFTEIYTFDFDFVDYSDAALDRACQALFVMAGVSYYKAYLAEEIVLRPFTLDKISASFFSKTYQKGLGEFFYTNKLNPTTPVIFPFDTEEDIQTAPNIASEGLLVGIGGGKDSLVSVELLRALPKVATWSVGHRTQLEPLIQKIGLPHFWVERQIDKKLIELNSQGALNGHIPISAILSCVGAIVAVLAGYQDIVVSNENSSNEETLTYQGVSINHQYSKTSEYEQDFQNYLKHHFSQSIRYYSFLRPLSEVYIAELFAHIGFGKYRDVFSSCNRAFRQGQDAMSWCGECSKCAFTFLAFTPFIQRNELESLWGKNLLLTDSLEPTYRQLLGIEGSKPLDCVGEVKESREAMKLAFQKYPELRNKYEFYIPENYSYTALAPHSMPESIAQILFSALG